MIQKEYNKKKVLHTVDNQHTFQGGHINQCSQTQHQGLPQYWRLRCGEAPPGTTLLQGSAWPCQRDTNCRPSQETYSVWYPADTNLGSPYPKTSSFWGNVIDFLRNSSAVVQ